MTKQKANDIEWWLRWAFEAVVRSVEARDQYVMGMEFGVALAYYSVARDQAGAAADGWADFMTWRSWVIEACESIVAARLGR